MSMIKGMTGFGSAEFSSGKIKGSVEIKSQNHRYFDPVFYLPSGFASIENNLKQLINKIIIRGRVTLAIKITDKPQIQLSLNKETVKEYMKYAKMLKAEYGLANNLTLADMIRLPGVIEAREYFVDVEGLSASIESAVKRAAQELVAMRIREGRALAKDTTGVLSRMHLQLKKIGTRAKIILKERKATLTSEELLSFQKSTDINEEVARLAHYIQEFRLLLKSTTEVGKKLDFVAQEMQRETNTIGSKLQDQIVTNAVVALKSKIEKLREQAQNIE
jgi:uncharacterized protein (TIGR00255 family)